MAHIIRDEQGRATRLVGGTRASLARPAIDRHRESLALLSQAGDAAWAMDLAQGIISWNRAAEELYGWSAAEAIGNFADVCVGLSVDDTDERVMRTVRRGQWAGDLQVSTRHGDKRTILSRWSVMYADDGEPLGILVIDSGVTQARSLERQIEFSNRSSRRRQTTAVSDLGWRAATRL
jgi:PAS domain S-box-containing protein